MFQRATNPTYKKLWDNVVSFNSSSLDSLSLNHSYHLEKVHEGNYVYTIGVTPAKAIMREHCDIAIADEEFSFAHFAVALQKNSAYTKEVDKM